MAECSYARCIQERRAIKRELQSWTKNMVYVLGLERVAEELMGRRKWELYQETLLTNTQTNEHTNMPAAETQQTPTIKIKTIEQINTSTEEEKQEAKHHQEPTILETLIKRPSVPPNQDDHEKLPNDWKPQDKCYFCTDGEIEGKGVALNEGRNQLSPVLSESDSSSESGERSPSVTSSQSVPQPALLAHLLQLQNQNPQALAQQFQSMMAALTALGGFPALQQAWFLRLAQQQQNPTAALLQQTTNSNLDRLPSDDNKTPSSLHQNSTSPFQTSLSERTHQNNAEQPLDLSAKSSSNTETSSTSPTLDLKVAHRVPPIDPKFHDRLKRSSASPTVLAAGASGLRRPYTDDELQSALKDITSGKLGTRRAAVLYGIPRSTLRNKVYKMQDSNNEDEGDSANEDDWPVHASPFIRSLLLADNDNEQKEDPNSGVILKIPTFPPPEDGESTSTPLPRTPNFFADPTPPNLPLLSDLEASALRGERLVSLRDVIAKSISQKFQRPNADGASDLSYDRVTPRSVSVIKNFPQEPIRNSVQSVQRDSNMNNNNNNNGANSLNNQATGKGTRPKRGKYRNYDRDSLVEAVKAVQRGEMSVHRAGSYYGVPHSTLEYKVKERHLMRPRKREPKNPPGEVGGTARPTAATPTTRLTPKPATGNTTASSKQAASPTSANGVKSGGAPFDPAFPYPFWPRGALGAPFPPFPQSPELFTSHVMQRLREDATSNRPPPANGSFLEGIIRSSLERPPERPGSGSEGSPPPQRRPRLDSSESNESVQRLRSDRNDRTDVPAHL